MSIGDYLNKIRIICLRNIEIEPNSARNLGGRGTIRLQSTQIPSKPIETVHRVDA